MANHRRNTGRKPKQASTSEDLQEASSSKENQSKDESSKSSDKESSSEGLSVTHFRLPSSSKLSFHTFAFDHLDVCYTFSFCILF